MVGRAARRWQSPIGIPRSEARRLGPPVDVEGDVHDHDVGFGEGGGIGDAAQVALAVHAVDGSVESGIGCREWEGARCKCLDARRPGSIRRSTPRPRASPAG